MGLESRRSQGTRRTQAVLLQNIALRSLNISTTFSRVRACTELRAFAVSGASCGSDCHTQDAPSAVVPVNARCTIVDVSHLRYIENMKTTTIPPLRVSQKLRREVEDVLEDGETLSSFMLEALQQRVAQRRDQKAFLERGLASAAKARKTGRYVDAGDVVVKLERRLADARKRRTGS